MPRYRYLAFDMTGARERGSVESASQDQAWQRLAGMGLTVVDLTEDKAAPMRWPGASIASATVPLAIQAELAEQMAVLLKARLTDLQMVHALRGSTSDRKMRRILTRMHQLMEQGILLPEAFRQAGSSLSPMFSSVAQIGQAGNTTSQTMTALAGTLRRQSKVLSQIGGALVYPIILAIAGIIVFLIVTTTLTPQLAAIFASLNRPLPAELGIFVSLGNGLTAWGPLLALILACLSMAATWLMRRHKLAAATIALRLPVIGALLRDTSLARLTGSLALLLRAGIPATAALRKTSEAYVQLPLASIFSDASTALENGRRASAVFADAPLIPPLFRDLYTVGETSNTLPDVLDAVAAALEGQAERNIQRLMALLTPMLTLAIGGGIAFLVYSVMGALLSINDLTF